MSALTFDANTSSQYLFDSLSYAGPPSYLFTTSPVGGSALGNISGATGLGPPDTGDAPKLNGESIRGDVTTGTGAYQGTLDATTRTLFINGVWTVDISFRPLTGQTIKGMLFGMSGSGTIGGSWAAEQDNYLFSIYRDTSSQRIYVMWQSGSGGTVTRRAIATAFLNEWNFISVSMQASATAGKLKMTVHHNGVKMGDWDLLDPPTGATNSGKVVVGEQGCTFDDQYRFFGDIDELRISSVHRSDADCVTAAGTIVATTGITLSVPTAGAGTQVYDRSWRFSLNNTRTPATVLELSRYTLWSMCSALIGGTFGGFGASAGKWTLIGTSNGVAASLDGTDRLNLSGTFTATDWVPAAAGVAHSWAVFQSPTMNGKTFYWLISFGSPGDNQCTMGLSTAAYTGGSVTADPTSTDSWVISATQTVTLNANATSACYFSASLSETGDFIYTMVRIAAVSVNNPTAFAIMVVAPVGVHASDNYPLYAYTGPFFNPDAMCGVTTPSTRLAHGALGFSPIVLHANPFVSGAAAVDSINGAVLDLPCWVIATGTTQLTWHHRGRLPDILMTGRTIGAQFPAYSRTIKDGGGNIRYCVIAGVAVPANAAYLFA